MTDFVHLHRHSEFSLLDGLGNADHYAQRAKELGQEALAITDHGSMMGVLYHIEACDNAGIKAINGMEAYFRQDLAADKERMVTLKNGRQRKGDLHGYDHLVLLAKNQEGFQNLMRLTTVSNTPEYFYQYANVTWKTLRQHAKGLIASSSCVNGTLPKMILNEQPEEAEKYLRVMQDIFGDDYYLEIQPHDFDKQRQVNLYLVGLATKFGIPLVATQDTHYPEADWFDTQRIEVLMKGKVTLADQDKLLEVDPDAVIYASPTLWLTAEHEMVDLFMAHHSSFPADLGLEAIKNTKMIADRCENYVFDRSPKVPKATKSTLEAERIIREWSEEGLIRIGKQDDQVYRDRLEEELSVMRTLKVFDYFVIVGDMVRWAKDQGIRVGPGRGSAAGSLVNYLIKITAVDPIGYDLLFERFLNEYRTELPDIDIDFQHDRRDEVKDYLIDKWGSDYVVNVSAFQSFGFKGAVKDTGRVLGIPYIELERATKNIPDLTFNETWETLRKAIKELDAIFKKYPELEKHAYRFEGQMKSQSQHAAAVIVTDRPARDLIPMMKAKDGTMVTQWSERANAQLISPYGFLKIDMLSTDALTNQAACIDLIEQRHGVKIDFEDVHQFPVNESPYKVEEDIVKAFADGANLGIFQFASRGIVGLLRDIKPQNLEHVIAANALYRPGTLSNGVAFDYGKRKNGSQEWRLPHESMEQFIGTTYGFMVYQEQVMQIFRILGKDVQPSAAAVFLKVVAKGIARDIEGKEKLQKYYDQFAAGCEEKSIPKASYDQVWDQILQMTTYAFNKSHSTGYALQAYQDMWLKRHYPLEFYACLLTTETDKIPEIIREGKSAEIQILPPDVNTSDDTFTVDGDAIRFGLLGIKYVGDAAIPDIKKNRPYGTYEDFYEKVPKNKVNKRVKLNLFQAGAFDSLGGRNKWVMNDEALPTPGEMTEQEKVEGEKASLGYILSQKSEVDQYKTLLKERVFTMDELDKLSQQQNVVVGGEIFAVKEYQTRKGLMAFVDLRFGTDEYATTWWSNKYSDYQPILTLGSAILVSGTWDPERKSVLTSLAMTAQELQSTLSPGE